MAPAVPLAWIWDHVSVAPNCCCERKRLVFKYYFTHIHNNSEITNIISVRGPDHWNVVVSPEFCMSMECNLFLCTGFISMGHSWNMFSTFIIALLRNVVHNLFCWTRVLLLSRVCNTVLHYATPGMLAPAQYLSLVAPYISLSHRRPLEAKPMKTLRVRCVRWWPISAIWKYLYRST